MNLKSSVRSMKTVWFAGVVIIALAAIIASIAPLRAQEEQSDEVYVAELQAVNTTVSEMTPAGRAEFRVTGDNLTITVTEQGLAPDTMYMQHLHGFMNDEDAKCATSEEDFNKDGIVDIREAAVASGIDMIPMTDDPASLEINSKTYPKTNDQGMIQYTQTVSLPELREAVKAKYGVEELDLEDMVFMLHGIAPEKELPGTVKSEHGLPPQAVLPIACGKIVKQEG